MYMARGRQPLLVVGLLLSILIPSVGGGTCGHHESVRAWTWPLWRPLSSPMMLWRQGASVGQAVERKETGDCGGYVSLEAQRWGGLCIRGLRGGSPTRTALTTSKWGLAKDAGLGEYTPSCLLGGDDGVSFRPPRNSHVSKHRDAQRGIAKPYRVRDHVVQKGRDREMDVLKAQAIEQVVKRFVGGLETDAPAPPLPTHQQESNAGDSARGIDSVDAAVDYESLTPEQRRALDFVKEGKSIFLTGSAGTGKSFVLKNIIRELRRRHGASTVHVTASTGAAAVLIGGTTVHSFAGVGLGAGDVAALVTRVQSNKQCLVRWKRAKALIIDEVSMIDSELFGKISYVAQRVRDNSRPFGGLQLVLTGDFFQLPPVSDGARKFAFESDIWDEAVQNIVELKQVMRQGDSGFVRILNELRWGNISAASYRELMKCQDGKSCQMPADGVVDTKLHPYNVNVRAENEKRLQQLPGEARTYTAVDRIQNNVGGRHSELTTVRPGSHHAYSGRLDQLNVERAVTLKVNAQVMCLKNLDVAAGLVNGARGVVTGFDSNTTASGDSQLLPRVKFVCGIERIMGAETWTVYDGEKPVADRKQIPLSLAWAVSVHKCQGMTLDRVEASLSKAFDHGMVYVALSRVKSLEGLKLSGFVPSKVTAHPAVVAFYRKLGCVPPGEEGDGGGVVVDGGAAVGPAPGEMKEMTFDELMKDRGEHRGFVMAGKVGTDSEPDYGDGGGKCPDEKMDLQCNNEWQQSSSTDEEDVFAWQKKFEDAHKGIAPKGVPKMFPPGMLVSPPTIFPAKPPDNGMRASVAVAAASRRSQVSHELNTSIATHLFNHSKSMNCEASQSVSGKDHTGIGSGFGDSASDAARERPRLPIAPVAAHDSRKFSQKEWKERFISQKHSASHSWPPGAGCGISPMGSSRGVTLVSKGVDMASSWRGISSHGDVSAGEKEGVSGFVGSVALLRQEALDKAREREAAVRESADRPARPLVETLQNEFVPASDMLMSKVPSRRYFMEQTEQGFDGLKHQRVRNVLARLGRKS